MLGCIDETLRRELTVLDVENGAKKHDLTRELRAKEIGLAARRAGMQVGQRIGRDRIRTGEIHHHGIPLGAWN